MRTGDRTGDRQGRRRCRAVMMVNQRTRRRRRSRRCRLTIGSAKSRPLGSQLLRTQFGGADTARGCGCGVGLAAACLSQDPCTGAGFSAGYLRSRCGCRWSRRPPDHVLGDSVQPTSGSEWATSPKPVRDEFCGQVKDQGVECPSVHPWTEDRGGVRAAGGRGLTYRTCVDVSQCVCDSWSVVARRGRRTYPPSIDRYADALGI